MIGFFFIMIVSFLLFRLLGGAAQFHIRRSHPAQIQAAKIDELTEYASALRRTNQFNKAEKVYLQILKIDHKHAPTYSRLGTLYSIHRNKPDAVECFQMAAQLAPSGSTYYNLGLGYYENKNFMKAVAAFEKAIMFEPSVQRYVGLAKAFSKVNDGEQMLRSLERAVDIEPNPKVLWLLADAYAAAGRTDELPEIYDRIKAADPKDKRLKETLRKQKSPRKPRVRKLEKQSS